MQFLGSEIWILVRNCSKIFGVFIGKFASVAFVAIANFAVPQVAFADDNSNDKGNVLVQRHTERAQQRWQLSDWLSMKAKMREQDFLYRMYTSEKTKPQIEPHLYVLAASGSETTDGQKISQYQLGYGASVYFNHVVSGLTGWATPNIVLGGFVEKRDVMSDSEKSEHLKAGGSLRFFAKNHSDSAIFLNYTFVRRPLNDSIFREWVWDVGTRIYLLPFLDVEGGVSLNQNFLQGNPSARASDGMNYYGVSVEASSVRMTLRQESQKFSDAQGREVRNAFASLALGLVI